MSIDISHLSYPSNTFHTNRARRKCVSAKQVDLDIFTRPRRQTYSNSLRSTLRKLPSLKRVNNVLKRVERILDDDSSKEIVPKKLFNQGTSEVGNDRFVVYRHVFSMEKPREQIYKFNFSGISTRAKTSLRSRFDLSDPMINERREEAQKASFNRRYTQMLRPTALNAVSAHTPSPKMIKDNNIKVEDVLIVSSNKKNTQKVCG